MSMDDVRPEPERDPEEYYEVRDENQKRGFPVEQKNTGDQEGAQEDSRCEGCSDGLPLGMDFSNCCFVREEKGESRCCDEWEPPPPAIGQRHVQYVRPGNQSQYNDDESRSANGSNSVFAVHTRPGQAMNGKDQAGHEEKTDQIVRGEKPQPGQRDEHL